MATQVDLKRPQVRLRGPRLSKPVARNVEIVGHSDMDGRLDGLQMQCQQANGRYYLYVGHFWSGGTTILDVTDPAAPTVAAFILLLLGTTVFVILYVTLVNIFRPW